MSQHDLPRQPEGVVADVALLLEGTYPFVSGGVSSWVHEIIRGLPHLTFSLVFIGSKPEDYGAPRYELPRNVVHIECHYLTQVPPGPNSRGASPDAFADSARLHDALREAGTLPTELLARVFETLGAQHGVTRHAFETSEAAWDQITGAYRRHAREPSFVDYFWAVRSMHQPLFLLAAIARELPPARVFHAISTGYAGLLGAMLRQQRKRPFLLTEHGIYTKERKIDLAHATWIREDRSAFTGTGDGIGYVRRLWTRFFEGLGRMTYASADTIVSLYEGNRERQIRDGADGKRTRVIPNGIELERFAPLRAQRPPNAPPVLGLLGRVVPIKDVRTFIRAMKTVTGVLPDAEGWIIGPTSEDVTYARECAALVGSLGLSGRVKFLGFRKPEEVLPQLGLIVLTSISEALPLVLLEGFASGLPALATDVGACREIIEGRHPEDRALGNAGAVVPIADPEATARAALSLLTDPDRWRAAQRAAVARVETWYTAPQMLDAYREVYGEALSWRA